MSDSKEAKERQLTSWIHTLQVHVYIGCHEKGKNNANVIVVTHHSVSMQDEYSLAGLTKQHECVMV